MSMITKLALQGIALFAFAWVATVASHWSSEVVGANATDRLAQLNQMSGQSVSVAERGKKGSGEALVSSAE
jgi:outer membrane lipoprotein-sorting protein